MFKGELEYVSFVKVEFISKEQMLIFKKPNWFGEDITQKIIF